MGEGGNGWVGNDGGELGRDASLGNRAGTCVCIAECSWFVAQCQGWRAGPGGAGQAAVPLGLSLSSALCARCSGRCRAKPKRAEDEPARRRSMRLLREPPLDVPLLDRLPQPEAEQWVRWGGAAGGLGALQLSEATAGDTAAWHWASH